MGFIELKPSTDEEWLELRTKVVTATEAGVLLGLNKWKSVRDIIEGKKNITPFENSYTWLGQELEPVVVSAVNKVLKKNFKLFENGSRSFFVDEEKGLGATPDAGDEFTLLECKSTKPRNSIRWSNHPPAYYLCQLYVQLLCTGREVGYLGILSTDLTQYSEELNLGLHIHELRRSPELDAIIIETVKEFWKHEKIGKVYRVKRQRAPKIEMLFRMQTRKVYGR